MNLYEVKFEYKNAVGTVTQTEYAAAKSIEEVAKNCTDPIEIKLIGTINIIVE